jgi:hypothetical protein
LFPPDDPHLRRFVRIVLIAGGASLVVYLGILWGMRIDPLRTALDRPDLANVYDLQARRLMHGHLSVPRDSLGIEGFIERGHEFMYFTPGPALARIPLFLFTSWFDGKLTAVSMLLAWCTTVTFFAMLIWRVRRVLRGKAALPQWEAYAYGLLIVAGCGGSVLVYLASMPWVYHEAYAWAIASAVAGAFALIGVVQHPTRGRASFLTLIVLAGVLCRATTGWALAFGSFATAGWFLLGGRGPAAKALSRRVIAAGALPLLIGIGINMAKFDHPYEFRLEHQVWTSVNEHRREALEANGGDLVALNLLPSTLISYFRPDGIRFIGVPPFVTFPNDPAHSYGGGFLDQTYRTGSAVPFMPALVLLGVWGLVTTFRPRGPTRAVWLRIPVLASGAITGAVLVYGYIAYRYVAELLPVLLLAATIGLVDLGHLLSLHPPRVRQWFLGAFGALAGFAVLANGAVSLTTLSLANPGPRLDRYLGVQESGSRLLPGDPLTSLVDQGDALPPSGPGEHLFIVGDCAGLYVSQNETFWPWVPAEIRSIELTVTNGLAPIRSARRGGRIELRVKLEIAHNQGQDGGLFFEISTDDRYRLHYISESAEYVSHWHRPKGASVTVRAVPNLHTASYTVSTEGRVALQTPLEEVDEDWFRFEDLLVPTTPDRAVTRQGLVVRQAETPKPPRCERLQATLDG